MQSKEQSLINKSDNIRNSSIELLKITGIVLIVISHGIQTLNNSNDFVGVRDYVVDLSMATTNIQYLILSMLCSCSHLGNTIFFICSAWFFLDNDRVIKKKILQMLLDIWVVSILFFIVVYSLRGGDIGLKMIISIILPTTFENNWYMTCYLLFYPMHPFLNWIIKKMNQATLLRTTLVLSFLYLGVDFVHGEHFFTSSLILWVVIYFLIAYMKYYLTDVSNDIRINTILL